MGEVLLDKHGRPFHGQRFYRELAPMQAALDNLAVNAPRVATPARLPSRERLSAAQAKRDRKAQKRLAQIGVAE